MAIGEFRFTPFSHDSYGLVESIRANPLTGAVSWVDIEAGDHVTVRENQREYEEVFQVRPNLSFAEPLTQGGFIFAAGQQLGCVDAQGKVFLSEPLLTSARRFNDGAVDALGRLIIGSMNFGPSDGSNVLIVFEHDGEPTVLDSDIGLSNGIAISPETGGFFSVDTLAGVIFHRELDHSSGRYEDRRIFHRFSQGEHPDGITLSQTGHLVVALWGGSGLAIIDQDGNEVQRVAVPPVFATSVCIAPETGVLFVGGASQPREGRVTPHAAGGVWSSPSPLKGYPLSSWAQESTPSSIVSSGSGKVIA